MSVVKRAVELLDLNALVANVALNAGFFYVPSGM